MAMTEWLPVIFRNYSYLKASIGSNLDAFIAGYTPETIATIKVVINAAIIASHGITKSNPKLKAIMLPSKIPSKIPIKPPNWLIINVSVKNCQS